MSQLKVMEFDSVSIGANGVDFAAGVEGTDFATFSGVLVDGREVNLPEPVMIQIDNRQEIPVTQEASFVLPFISDTEILAALGDTTPTVAHLVTHNTTVAGKADIRLNGVAGSVNMTLTNVQISLIQQLVESEGENVVAYVLRARARGSFGSVVRIENVA